MMLGPKEFGLARGLKSARGNQNKWTGRWPEGQLYHMRHGRSPECELNPIVAKGGAAAFPVVFASFIVTDRQEFSP